MYEFTKNIKDIRAKIKLKKFEHFFIIIIEFET